MDRLVLIAALLLSACATPRSPSVDAPGLRGRIVDGKGQPVAGARILVLDPATDWVTSLGHLQVPRFLEQRLQSNRSGRFAVGQLAAGMARVKIESAEHAPVTRDVELGADSVASLDVKLEPGARLIVTAHADNAPCPRVEVVVMSADETPAPVFRRAITDQLGHARFDALPADCRLEISAARVDHENPLQKLIEVHTTRRELKLKCGSNDLRIDLPQRKRDHSRH